MRGSVDERHQILGSGMHRIQWFTEGDRALVAGGEDWNAVVRRGADGGYEAQYTITDRVGVLKRRRGCLKVGSVSSG
jgi:hypothetical protein